MSVVMRVRSDRFGRYQPVSGMTRPQTALAPAIITLNGYVMFILPHQGLYLGILLTLRFLMLFPLYDINFKPSVLYLKIIDFI